MATTQTAPTLYTESTENGVRFAYRRIGEQRSGGVPIVMHIHFRGNMDHWDPLLIDEIAKERQVILFDNAGMGRSSGEVPSEFSEWAKDLISFVRALGLEKIDLLGFSMGGLAVIETALAAPDLIRKLIIAGSTASIPSSQGQEQNQIQGIVWPRETVDPKYVTALASAVTVEEGRDALKYGCFPPTPAASAAFDAYWARLEHRTAEPAQLGLLAMVEKGGQAQIASILAADVPKPGNNFDRLGELKIPVLVANGDTDVLIPTSRSWKLLHQIDNAQLIIYPKSGHGFLWQYAQRFAQDVNRFLNGRDFEA